MLSDIKTILVSLNNLKAKDGALNAARAISEKYDSHIIGLYVIPAIILYEAPYSFGANAAYTMLHRMYLSKSIEVEQQFNEFLQKNSLSGEFRKVNSVSQFVSDQTIEHGRQADLIILGEDKSSGTDREFQARLIEACGRPVLVVPNTTPKDVPLHSAIVGWDGSRESARAAFDAIPILRLADNVEITCFNAKKEREISGDLPGAELAVSLARYGVKSQAVSEKTRKSPGKALIERAKHADMLVIGAYGHSRLRESLWGGVTQSILSKLPCPVLFSS
ncbi:MAG: universal stress protein [Hellea sp.]|nr:universal stress protein [Hellea sp.]